MAKLPTDLSGQQLKRALERAGFVFRRQRGSHMILRRNEPYARVIIPDHKQIRVGPHRKHPPRPLMLPGDHGPVAFRHI